ncbi:MAG TPA: hypothetical protein VG318_12240 [Actinomycetota bacterium]|nr:hypothetical protein [Actinomycetota bacterium]
MEDLGFVAAGYVIFKITVGTYLIRLWRRSRRARREAAAASRAV